MKKSYITTGALALTGALVFGGAGVALADGAAEVDPGVAAEKQWDDAWGKVAEQNAPKAEAAAPARLIDNENGDAWEKAAEDAKKTPEQKKAEAAAKAEQERKQGIANGDGNAAPEKVEADHNKATDKALKDLGVDNGNKQAWLKGAEGKEQALKAKLDEAKRILASAEKSGNQWDIDSAKALVAQYSKELGDFQRQYDNEIYFHYSGIDANAANKLVQDSNMTPEEKAEVEKELAAATTDAERAEIINKLIEEGKITVDGAKATTLPKTGDAATAGAFAGFAALMAGALVAARKKVLG